MLATVVVSHVHAHHHRRAANDGDGASTRSGTDYRSNNIGVADPVRRLRPVHRRRQSASTASLSRFGRTSIGVSAFDAVLKQLAGLGVDTDFVCHYTILDIEGIA